MILHFWHKILNPIQQKWANSIKVQWTDLLQMCFTYTYCKITLSSLLLFSTGPTLMSGPYSTHQYPKAGNCNLAVHVQSYKNTSQMKCKTSFTIASLAGWVTFVTYLRLAVLVEARRAASLALSPVPQEDVVISTAQTVCTTTPPAVFTRGVTSLTDHGGGVAKVTKIGGKRFNMWCLLPNLPCMF